MQLLGHECIAFLDLLRDILDLDKFSGNVLPGILLGIFIFYSEAKIFDRIHLLFERELGIHDDVKLMTYLLAHCYLVSYLFDECLLLFSVESWQIVEEASCHCEVLRLG